jgi:hypothetical protein
VVDETFMESRTSKNDTVQYSAVHSDTPTETYILTYILTYIQPEVSVHL